MLASKQVLIRMPQLLLNQVDASAKSLGLSRNSWINGTLESHLAGSLRPGPTALNRLQAESVVFSHMLLESWLVHEIGPAILSEIKMTACALVDGAIAEEADNDNH